MCARGSVSSGTPSSCTLLALCPLGPGWHSPAPPHCSRTTLTHCPLPFSHLPDPGPGRRRPGCNREGLSAKSNVCKAVLGQRTGSLTQTRRSSAGVRNSDTDAEDPSLGLWLGSVEAAGPSSLWLASLPAPGHRADGLCTKTAECPSHKFVGCQDPPVPPGGAQWELNSEPVSALGSPAPASLRPCWEAQEGARREACWAPACRQATDCFSRTPKRCRLYTHTGSLWLRRRPAPSARGPGVCGAPAPDQAFLEGMGSLWVPHTLTRWSGLFSVPPALSGPSVE